MVNKKQQIVKILSTLQLAYSTDLSIERLEMYVEMLADINPVTLEQAIKNIVKTRKFLPTIAEIREECSALSAYVNAHEELPTPQSAWERTIKCASTYGYEHGLEHLDGLTLKCAKSIWSSFNPLMGDEYNEASCRAQFIKQYEQEEKREMHRQRMANSIKDNHILLKAREKAEKEQAMITSGQKQIEMTRTGNLVEVAKETNPVDLNKILDNADISEKGKALLRQAIGG
uniref:Replisome organizer n=1 Tax=Podoviridae sp. ct0dB2 TaxID=2826535 RepID=A0A8S5N824_9CAUD|nr:MAG TPA: replisome organizer [Podoviridae sp. ct0dB2]